MMTLGLGPGIQSPESQIQPLCTRHRSREWWGQVREQAERPHNRRKPDPMYKMQACLAWWLCWEDSGGAASEPGGGREDEKRKTPAEDENASKARVAGRKQ